MNKIKEVIFRDNDNLLRFLEIVVLSSIPVIFLLILIRLFNVDNIFLGSDLTSLVFAINAGILMERNGIYRENSVRDFAMIFPIFMFAICFLCLLALFIHSQNVYPVFDNDYFKPIFSILVIILAVFSILIGLFYALQSRLRF